MAFVHEQAAKLDEQTKVSGEQSLLIKEQSFTIEKQTEMIKQLRNENKVRIIELFSPTVNGTFNISRDKSEKSVTRLNAIFYSR